MLGTCPPFRLLPNVRWEHRIKMLPWTSHCDGDDDEWARRARLANRRYMRALVMFEHHHRTYRPVKKRPSHVPDALRQIINEVCEQRQVSLGQLKGRSRKRPLVDARRTIAIMARAKGCSYPQIGHALNRDHTTIMHHVGALA